MNAKPYRIVSLSFGYAESGQQSPLIFDADCTFNTAKEAFFDLAHGLLEKYLDDHGSATLRACCKKSKGKFCGTCGSKKEVKVNMWDYMSFLQKLPIVESNDFGEEIRNGWMPCSHLSTIVENLKHYQFVEVDQYAERSLILALDPGFTSLRHPKITEVISSLKEDLDEEFGDLYWQAGASISIE